METDVGQMLTAGVGLKAWEENVCMGCGGGAEGRVEDAGPRVSTRTCVRTGAGCRAGSGQCPLSRCCPGRFSHPVGKGRGNYLVSSPSQTGR